MIVLFCEIWGNFLAEKVYYNFTILDRSKNEGNSLENIVEYRYKEEWTMKML